MFNLDQKIGEWRQEMRRGGVSKRVLLDELEAHLRDGIEEQIHLGLTPEQAFAAVARELGAADALGNEFERALYDEPWGQKWTLKWIGVFVLALNAFYVIGQIRWIFSTTTDFTERAVGLAALGVGALLTLAFWRLIPRFFPVIRNRIIESLVVSLGVLSGMIWLAVFAVFIFPRFASSTPGWMLDAYLWAFIPGLISPMFFLGVQDRNARLSASA